MDSRCNEVALSEAPPSSGQAVRLDRRRFLAAAATAAAAVGAPTVQGMPAVAHGSALAGAALRSLPRDRFSIQLFTVRDQLAIDFEGTLAALAQIGYRRVEHAGFVGRTATEFKAALDAVGIRATSGHVSIPQPFNAGAWNASLQDARVLQSRFIVHPFFGIDFATGAIVRDSPTWSAFARDLNVAGRMASQVGLQLGYHNHNWEFFRLSDRPAKTAFDLLAEQTDPRYVHLELDLFWAWRGAQDPVDLVKRLGDRVRQYHVKDMNQAGSFEDPGRGLIDFVRVFRARSVAEYIVERDDAGTPPRTPQDALDTARVGYEYLVGVKV